MRVHGGGVDAAMHELGLGRSQICDFSASINPLGVPPGVQQALQQALGRITDYPEIDGASLRLELARFHQLPEAHLLPGSGSTELIYLLPRVLRPRRALLIQPGFGEYAPALQQVGCQIDHFSLDPQNNFAFNVSDILAVLQPHTDLVVLANPGNPSGVGIVPGQLIELADRLGDCRLLVDEAFVDFCPERSLISRVVERQNLLLLRSMTKFYAIPGLRAGYLAGSAADIRLLAAGREPWSLSNLAIVAARACLKAETFQLRTLEMIPRLRAQFQQGLEQLGWQVFAGEANYLLCRLPDHWPPAPQIVTQLRPQGLLLRSCCDFLPLDRRYLRFAVLREEQNLFLLQALGKLASVCDGA
ncbi:pyridoxal phosphate-dependent aminotransferase [Geopsychrobacter electrodiphilus]|uniref:pyridoxal phosphate-dependent aminotransferase n=1 Tax=Geopsychrobacter electrodiphilus TaxID=225196 RepID=UPI000361DD91|nr:threonine-phosphate decarboxylase [Geopsychrobacter electrodiphilus]